MFKLTPVMQKFILHWGEMGTRWGVNRTVAQIHALLFLSPRPLNAEEIAETLSVARSNVSTSLHELQSWRIVKVVHQVGDRRDYYESMKDVWQMFRVIAEERKRREIDPTLQTLEECTAELSKASGADSETKVRLEEMHEFFKMLSSAYDEMKNLPIESAISLFKMTGKVKKFLGVGAR